MSIRFLKLSLASPESIRSWTERRLPNGKRVGKILKGDLIDYKNGLPIRDGLSCERIFGPMVSFTCTCGRFKCIETRGIHIVHDTLRSSRPILPDVSNQTSNLNIKQWGEMESSFQASSNRAKLERNREIDSLNSQKLISKPVKKLVSNQKHNQKLFKTIKSIDSSTLQPIVEYCLNSNDSFSIYNQFLNGIRENKSKAAKRGKYIKGLFSAYKQKKMIRFISDFYYDYQSTYHCHQNQMVPSFVSILEEPYTINLSEQRPRVNFFKQQTIWYNSKLWPISKLLNFSYPIEGKYTVGLKMHSSMIQHTLKPLYKFRFQIYTKFWFDLKVNFNNFIYEKQIFLWVPQPKKSQKINDSFKMDPSFFSKFIIKGLQNKSQKLPIIGKILPDQKVFRMSDLNGLNFRGLSILNRLNYGYPLCERVRDFPNLLQFLLVSRPKPQAFFKSRIADQKISNSALLLAKINPFFLVCMRTKKIPNNWYKVSILQDLSCIEFLFKNFKSFYLKPKNFLGEKLVQFYSSQICKSFLPTREKALDITYQIKIENTFFALRWLRITNFQMSLNKLCIFWLQRNQKIQLPFVLQQSIKFKKKKKTEPYLSINLHFIALDFGISSKFHSTIIKRAKTNRKPISNKPLPIKKFLNFQNKNVCVPSIFSTYANQKWKAQKLEKNTINSINQKSSFSISLLEKESASTQNIVNFLSLLVSKPLQLNDLRSKKMANPSFGFYPIPSNRGEEEAKPESLKIKSFDLKQKNLLSALKKINRNSPSIATTLFQSSMFSHRQNKNKLSILSHKTDKSDKKFSKLISIFDFFKKQELLKMALLTPNYNFYLTKLDPFSSQVTPYLPIDLQGLGRSGDKKKLVSSFTKSPQIRETFSPKYQASIKSNRIPLNLTTNQTEDVSKPYASSNTKQNIRVYKFKNFPPEEIRYCPYCEVELLPNSIRRYRLGYIEFISPVTHIWYTASSIPLLLNLSKTIIEGIASCHEALSSGFPPVYKWSYNGESPTSWTFQMQPLKLPINLIPKISSSLLDESSYHVAQRVKKSYYTEIIFGSNQIVYPNSQKPFHEETALLKIIPRELFSKNHFTMYEQRNKSALIKNAKINNKENINLQKKNELFDNDSSFLTPSINTTLNVSSLKNTHFFLNKQEMVENTLKKETQYSPNLFSWKDISYRFKYLWMFSDLSDNFFAKTRWFLSLFDNNSSILLNSKNLNNYSFINKNEMTKSFLLMGLLKHHDYNSFVSIGKRYLSYASGIFNFPLKLFLDNKKTSWFSLSQKKLIDRYFSLSKVNLRMDNLLKIDYQFLNPVRVNKQLIFKLLKTSKDLNHFFSAINNQQINVLNVSNEIMHGFPFFSQTETYFSRQAKKWGETQVSEKINSHYDPFTATEYEKKREWLKLEGFFEDPSNQTLPNNSEEHIFSDLSTDKSFINPNKQDKFNESVKQDKFNESVKSKIPDHFAQREQNYDNQKHPKSENETKEKNENRSKYLDNLSLPLVLCDSLLFNQPLKYLSINNRPYFKSQNTNASIFLAHLLRENEDPSRRRIKNMRVLNR